MFEMSELQFHEMGAKQIATFKIKPNPQKDTMTKSPVHTRNEYGQIIVDILQKKYNAQLMVAQNAFVKS